MKVAKLKLLLIRIVKVWQQSNSCNAMEIDSLAETNDREMIAS